MPFDLLDLRARRCQAMLGAMGERAWDDRVEAFWAQVDVEDADRALDELRPLVRERPDDDPEALFEWASVHDAVGREAEAVPLYRAALAAGLAGGRRARAVVQLASSLRNVGEPAAAVALLEGLPADTTPAAGAFLALALHDLGRHAEALRVALRALAPTLPGYGRAVAAYAEELVARPPVDDS